MFDKVKYKFDALDIRFDWFRTGKMFKRMFAM